MYKRFCLFSVFFVFCSFTAVCSDRSDSLSVSTSKLADCIIREAERYIGVPYRSGGKGPHSFDCSGFTHYVYAKFGYELSPSSSTQAAQGREVKGTLSNLQKGDIVVFGMRNNRKRIGHVGLFIGLDASGNYFTFIHASRKGIRISKSDEDYWAARFLGARRVLPDFLPDVGDGSAAAIDSTFTAFRDTLVLSENDYRVVILEDGTWAYVQEDGTVLRPSGLKDKIVLDTNGRWTYLPISMHKIPSMSPSSSQSTASKTTPSTSSASSVSVSSNPDGREAVYHTIKSGDTLYGLAHRYGTNVNVICRMNGITQSTVLKVGKKIRVK